MPANRMRRAVYSAAQVKTNQEIIALIGFAIFPVVVLDKSFKWNRAVGSGLLVAAAFFNFYER